MSDEKPLVARNINWLIKKANLDPTKLARALKERNPERKSVPQATIHRIIEGHHKSPRNSTIEPLAEFFSVKLSDILEWDFEKLGYPPTVIQDKNTVAEAKPRYLPKDPVRDGWIAIWDEMLPDERTHVLKAVGDARSLYKNIRDGTGAAAGGGMHHKKAK